jgi:thiamine-phosphate pyrophosphorylase
MARPRSDPRPAPRLYLVTPPVADAEAFARLLSHALPAADIAAVLLRLTPADERALINRIKALAPAVQEMGVALVLDSHADLVARSGADGAHLTGIDALKAAIPALKPSRIAGAGGLRTRHDAMIAGEAGADYVMFGEPDAGGGRPELQAIEDRVAWWAEVFEIPCVAYAGSTEEIGPLASAGADFVALGEWMWDAPDTPVLVSQAARRLAAETVS